MPKNVTLIFLSPGAAELNPVENLWRFLRQTYLFNRVFETCEEILDAAYKAWNRLVERPWRISQSDCVSGPSWVNPDDRWNKRSNL